MRCPEASPEGWTSYDIRTVHELLGHKNVKTTMIYTHVLNRGEKGVKSPIDASSTRGRQATIQRQPRSDLDEAGP